MPNERLQRSLRAVFIGLGVNVLLAVVKLSVGWIGHSYALVADAVESMGDIFSSLVVWRGLVVAATPADKEHPYGHGKAEPIAAAIVAGILLSSAMVIIFKAAEAISLPGARPEKFTLVVLLLALATKEILSRFMLREAAALDNLAVRTEAWHHRSDAIVSLAAAIGLSISLWGGPGLLAADKVAAIAAAAVIAWNGLTLLRPALDELMDRAPDEALVGGIAGLAATTPGVVRVEKCVVRKTGYQFLVDMHVEVPPDMTVEVAHNIAHQVKNRIREQYPSVLDVLVHIEPARLRQGVSP